MKQTQWFKTEKRNKKRQKILANKVQTRHEEHPSKWEKTKKIQWQSQLGNLNLV